MNKITCFGEVLWDVFPTAEKIGGAPLNVALRLKALRNDVSIISRIGMDRLGVEILEVLKEKDINIDGIQVDKIFETGVVNVSLDSDKSATYTIKKYRAWDNIKLKEESIKLVKESDAFVYGSLATRDECSRLTLYELLKIAKFKVLDLNLRPPFYTVVTLKHLMKEADLIKLNEEELLVVNRMLDIELLSSSIEENILHISEITGTKIICVTKGKDGAMLYLNDEFYHCEGYPIKVIDTVGAGDSLLASILNSLLRKDDGQYAINFACALGALVASKEGANPEIKDEQVDDLLAENMV